MLQIPLSQKCVEPLQKKFVTRWYKMNCEPRVTADGKYAAQVEVMKLGFSSEAAFRSLGQFDTETETEAVAYAKKSFRRVAQPIRLSSTTHTQGLFQIGG